MNYKNTIQKLLLTDYTDFLCSKVNVNSNNLKEGKTVAPTENTNKIEFDILDKQDTIIQETSSGSVTYENPEEKDIYITNYESYINSLPQSVQKGVKRCDFIVTENASFLILNELSQSKNEFSKESDAIDQLSKSLFSLVSCSNVREYFDSFSKKVCVFSNRCKRIESPNNIADAFFEPFEVIGKQELSSEQKIPSINDLGFSYYKGSKILIDSNEVKIYR